MKNKLLATFLNILKPNLQIYTDGSHKGKWGSWAFVVTKNNKIIHEASGRSSKTNSNRMEFQAAIEALTYLKVGASAQVYSDSRILIKAMQDNKDRSKNRPEANKDQIDALDKLITDRHITWKWIKAHSGIAFNERCDELCILARS